MSLVNFFGVEFLIKLPFLRSSCLRHQIGRTMPFKKNSLRRLFYVHLLEYFLANKGYLNCCVEEDRQLYHFSRRVSEFKFAESCEAPFISCTVQYVCNIVI